MAKKYFTLEEANQLLPEMKIELETLQGIKYRFEIKYAELQYWINNGSPEEKMFTLESELEFLQIEVKTHMQNIHHKGVELKDIEVGLIDFPSMAGGEEILLCWKLGESNIHYYHGIHEGFNGRKRIEN